MSHNLYLKRIPTASDKAKMHSMVDAGQFDLLHTFIELANQELHLGQFACGWKFKFDLNGGEYYEPTRESIIKFCEDAGYVVTGEEKVLTIREAFDVIDAWNADPKNHYIAKEYFTEHPEYYQEMYVREDNVNKYKELGYKVEYEEFENDGLVFSVNTDWE